MRKKFLSLMVLVAGVCAVHAQDYTQPDYFNLPSSFSLVADGTAGTEITLATKQQVYRYTPETTGEVVFSFNGSSVMVLEGANRDFKGYVLPTANVYSFPEYTANADGTVDNSLLVDGSFYNHGANELASGKWGFGEAWLTNVTPAAMGIRVGTQDSAVDGIVLVWRGAKNRNYFAQKLATALKANTPYKIVANQVASGNANADFKVGLGSTENGFELCSGTFKLGTSQSNTKSVEMFTGSEVPAEAYFTFMNTDVCSSGTDPVTQLDYVVLLEGAYTSPVGLTGAEFSYTLDAPVYPTTLTNGDFELTTNADRTLVTNSDPDDTRYAVPFGWRVKMAGNSCIGAYSYGSDATLNSQAAPAQGSNEAGGTYMVGVNTSWSSTPYLYQIIEIPAGDYVFSYDVYTTGSAPANVTGVYDANGNKLWAGSVPTESNVWTTQKSDILKFAENTVIEVRVGYTAADSGSGSNPKMYFDNLAFAEASDDIYREQADQLVAEAEAIDLTNMETSDEANALASAISELNNASGQADIEAAMTQLRNAMTVVENARPAYDELAVANAAAAKLGVEPVSMNTAEGLTQAKRQLNIAMFNNARQYQYTAPLGEWKITGASQNNHGQHWSDDANATYYEPNQWGNSSVNWVMEQDVTLLAGTYVLMATGRSAENTTLAMSVLEGAEVLNSTAAFPRHGTGVGVDVNGNPAFDATATYANGGKGWGWEWGFVPFTLDHKATVKLQVKATSGTTHQWASITEFELRSVNEVGVDREDMNAIVAALKDAKMDSEKLAAAQVLIDAMGEKQTFSKDEYEALKAAIEAANATVDYYAAAKPAIDNMGALIASTNVYTAEAYAAYNGRYEQLLADYEAGTLEGVIADPYAVTGWRAEVDFDAFLLSAWGIEPRDYSGLYINTWSTEGNNDGTNFKVPFYEYFCDAAGSLPAKEIPATVSGLEPNKKYLVEAMVRVEPKNGAAAPAGIAMQVGEGNAVDVCAGQKVGSSNLYLAKYVAVGTPDADGNLTVKFIVADDNNIHWLSFQHVKYEEVTVNIEDLKAAIEVAEKNVLGFAAGEYAPYANADALATLAAAKAINEENTQEEIDAALAALNEAAWTANAEAMPYIYNGDFALTENDGAPAGWRTTHKAGLGSPYHARVMVDKRLAVFNDTKSAFYMRFDGTNSDMGTQYAYGDNGNQPAYRMPLKAEQEYQVDLDFGGWGQIQNTRFYVVDAAGQYLSQIDKTPSGRVDQNGTPDHVSFKFTPTVDGNCVLYVQNPGANRNNAIVVSNIVIRDLADAENAELTALLAQADEKKAEAKTQEAKDGIDAAVAVANEVNAGTSEATAEEAIQGLNDAYAFVETSNALYDEVQGMIAQANEASAEATEKGKAVLAAAAADAETADTVEELNAAKASLEAAMALNANFTVYAGASLENPVSVATGAWVKGNGAQNFGWSENPKGEYVGKYWENWNPDAVEGRFFYQEIANMPAGVYVFKACLFANAIDAVHMYIADAIGENQSAEKHGTYFTVIGTLAENGTLEFGAAQDEAIANWAAIADATVAYYGETTAEAVDAKLKADALNAAKALYLAALEEANAVEGKMGEAAAAELAARKVDAETFATAQDATDATEALNSAVEAANSSIAFYAAAQPAIANMEVLAASTNVVTADALAAYNQLHSDLAAGYEAGTLDETKAIEDPYKRISHAEAHAEGYHSDAADLLLSAWNVAETGLYINNWSSEGENDGSEFKVPFYEYWVSEGNNLPAKEFVATVAGLTAGKKYIVNASVRVKGNGVPAGITMQVGEGDVVDVCAGEKVGDTQFYLGSFSAMGTADAEGNLVVKVAVAEGTNVNWLAFQNLNYTEGAVDLEALKAAIAKAEAMPLGFADGEYAPYNNVDPLAAIAAAKEITVDNTQAEIDEAANALVNAAWVANEGTVNAVYNGDFALTENDGAPAGWRSTTDPLGSAYHARAMVGDDRLAVFNDTKSAFYMRFDGTNSNKGTLYEYGNNGEAAYAMPLKAETAYVLSFDFGGWGQMQKARFFVTDAAGKNSGSIDMTPTASISTKGNTDKNHVEFAFTPSVDGNCIIKVQNPGASVNNAIIASNFQIIPEAEFIVDYVAALEGRVAEVKAIEAKTEEGQGKINAAVAAAEKVLAAPTLAGINAANKSLDEAVAFVENADAQVSALAALVATAQQTEAKTTEGQAKLDDAIALAEDTSVEGMAAATKAINAAIAFVEKANAQKDALAALVATAQETEAKTAEGQAKLDDAIDLAENADTVEEMTAAATALQKVIAAVTILNGYCDDIADLREAANDKLAETTDKGTKASLASALKATENVYYFKAEELATAKVLLEVALAYEPNLDFSKGEPVAEGICTYAKDMTTNGTTLSQQQPVVGWTIVENGDARAAGVFAYGDQNAWLGGKGYLAPATNPEGEAEGNALGLVAVWTATVQYVTPVYVDVPGKYTLTYHVFNTAGDASIEKSLFGFSYENQTKVLSTRTSYPVGEWVEESFSFTLDKPGFVLATVGYKAADEGSGKCPHLFVDRIVLAADNAVEVQEVEEVTDEMISTLETNVAVTDAVSGETVANAIALVDAVEYVNEIESMTANKVTYSRLFTNDNWQAFYVPFNVDAAEVVKYGELIALHAVTDDGANYTLHYHAVTEGELEPNTPYIFKPNIELFEDGELTVVFVGEKKEVKKAENADVTAEDWLNLHVHGTYALKTDMEGKYALSGDVFKKGTAKATLKPFRIYITTGAMPAQKAAPMRIVVEDQELSNIEDLFIEGNDGEFYDLQGRKVENPAPGFYIHNGKKVQVK